MEKTIEEKNKVIAIELAIKFSELPISTEELLEKATKIENYLKSVT